MRSNPFQVGSGFYRSLALGNNSTMAIDPYGTLSAWGENQYGQIGTNTVNNTLSWTQLSNGDAHSLALRSDNTLWAWGLNSSGQLGVGDTVARQSPTQISAKIDGVVTLTWSQVSAGASHSVAISSDNVAYGWGLNTSGQVGDLTVGNRSAPVQIGVAGTPANYSANFSGVGGTYLSVADNVALQFGTGTFTVELWFYATVQSSEYLISRSTTSPLNDGWGIQKLLGSSVLRVQIGGNIYNTGFTYKLNTWQHIAFTRDSNNDVRFFLNGVSSGIIVNTSYNLSEAASTIIGAYAGSSTNPYTGYISNLRILKGTALYTTNFTPSVSPFSNIANTVLLTCHTSNLADGSSNNFAITNNGGVTVSTLNPFVYYSGGLFNQSSHYLNVSGQQTQLSFGTGDFTIECFAFGTTPEAGGSTIIDFTPSGSLGLYPTIVMAQFNWYYNVNGVSVIIAGFGPVTNNWYHVALVRIAGLTKLYINGSQVGSTYTDTNNYGVGLNRPTIGSNGSTVGAAMFPGYLSNLRIVKGVGIYTGNFTIPTNILRTVQAAGTNITALSGTETSLLTLQNSTFIDNSINNFTITNNNSVPISSTVVPFVASPPAGGTGTLIASKISAGKDFTLAIKSDNTLWSWGLNTSYQLGSGITVPRSSPVQVGTNSWSQISAGGSHALAIDSNNLLYGWGNNSSGQVGVKVFSWTQVAGSTGTGFAIRDDGSLWAWGLNSWGQLGQNDIIHRSSPVAIGTDSWLQVSSGSLYVLAIRSDNTLWSWGYNNVGQLGLDSIAPRSSPVQVGTSSWSSVSAGTNSSLGIKTDTTLWAWGSNGTGQLGIGLTTSRSSPVQVSSAVTTWSVISISESIAAAISTSGGLYLWGLALANGTSVNRSSPVQLGTESWSAVATGLSSAIGIDTLGRLYSWGTNTNHQLGDNSALTVSRSSPVQLGASSWSIVSAGTSSSFAITTDSRLFAWGLNSSNQLGDGTAEPRSSPVQIGAGINFTKISSGSTNNSYAIDNDYYLYSWGNGNNGAIGDSTVATKLIPTQVGGVNNNTIFIKPFKIGESSWSAVSAGYSHSVALTSDNRLFTWGNNTNGQLGFTASFISVNAGNLITSVVRSDGTLWTWGFNNSGQLGNGTVILRSGPIQVGLLNNWSKTTKPSLTNYAINNTGKLYAWGENSIGSIGDNTTVSKSSPVQIGTSSWTMVVTSLIGGSGQQTAYAIRNDGILFAWGNNTYGGLANNLSIGQHSSSPIQIGSSSYSLVSAGSNFVLALASDNRLFAWGNNNNGQLGVTPTTYSWTRISTGRQTLAVRSDNKLFAWGFNQNGELGDNTTIAKSSPIFIYSGSFVSVAAGFDVSAFVTSDGKLFTWGGNLSGQLGDPTISTSTYRSSPTQISTDKSYIQVYAQAMDNNPIFAKRSDGTLWAWGNNARFLIGDNTNIDKSSPTQVSIGGSWNTVSIGQYHVLAIDSNDKLYTWGDITAADYSQFGLEQQFSWSKISSGGAHVLAIRSDGFLYAWGNNAQGQLGDNTSITRSSPVQVSAIDIYNQISAGFNASYAIRNDGKLFTWGYNAQGHLGDSTTINRSSPVQIDTSSWSQVYASTVQNYVLALRSDNTLYAWGDNSNYTLGDGTSINRSSPVQVGTSSWSQVSAGTSHALGITTDNKLFVWGNSNNSYFGQLGSVLPFSWSKIGSGGNHTLAIRSDNMLFGWGDNSVGQLGVGNTAYRSSPVQIGTSSWSQISSGLTFSLAIRSDGALFTWGYNTSGQLGDPTAPVPAGNGRSSPVQVGTSSWSQVVANKFVNSAFGLLIDNTLYAWGQNTNYTLGDGTSINRSSPVQIGTSSWISVASGTSHTLAIRSDNKLFVWGANTTGQQGDPTIATTVFRSSPTQLGTSDFLQVAAGINSSYAIRTDGALFAWGLNNTGQLGVGVGGGDTVNRSSPVQIGTSSWSAIGAGGSHAIALRSDGALFTWGANTLGVVQLGLGDGVARSSPVQVGTSSWSAITADNNGGFVLNNLGFLWGWGNNNLGQLGLNFIGSQSIPQNVGPNFQKTLSSPVQIGTSSWVAVSAGTNFSLAIRSDNALFAWGLNNTGQLGLTNINAAGDTVNRSSPVQVGTSSWTRISAGHSYSMALRSDGVLFAWGLNGSGQLGLSDTVNRSSPVQVGTSSWNAISAGIDTSVGLDLIGRLFTWANNSVGQLGNNSSGGNRNAPTDIGPYYNRTISSPVQVGTSSWLSVAAGSTHSLGILSDNTLYAWGYNQLGQLGLGDTVTRSNPVQVGLGTTVRSWTSVSAGVSHTLAIRNDGTLWGWGINVFGQLGGSNIISKSSPVQIGSSSYTVINASRNTSFGLNVNGILSGWGQNNQGQVGDGTTVDKSTPTALRNTSSIEYSPLQVGTSSWSTVSAGGSHAVGIKIDNTVFAWGLNNAGQLGDITVVSRSSPVQVGTVANALTNANAYSLYYDSGISGSRNMTTSTSSDWALGANWTIEFFLYLTTYPSSADVKWIIYQGGTPGIRIFIDYNPLGTFQFQADGSTVRFGTANSVPLLSWIHVAVVSTSGTAVVYFNGIAQSLSTNQGNGGYNLTATDGITLFNRPSGGTTQTNFNGYISNLRIVKGTSVYTSNFTTPANPLTAITNTVLLMAQNTTITTDNSGTSKVLTVNGTAPTYSLNTPFPSAIAGGAIFATQVNAGSSHSALIDTSNRLYTWGLNNAGQLGLGDTLARSAPTQIAINNIYKNITLGADHTIAIDFTDTLYAWGAGVYGQQGLGDTLYRSRPTQISSISLFNVGSPTQIGSSSYTVVSAGNNTSIALSSNNKLFAWGLGTTGQLGTGVTFSRSSPVQLSANSYNLISAGGTHTTFVPTISPQIILATGLGTSGQIGDITIISKSSPTQIGASNTKFNSPVTVSTGDYSSYYVSSPTQVGTSSWTSVSAGGTHTLGIKKDNTLYAWGYNANGQLGGSSTINRSSPVQVGTSSWSQVSAGDSHNVIAKSDGTINTFGLNTFGQLGDGT